MRSDSSKADIEKDRYNVMTVVSVCNVIMKLIYYKIRIASRIISLLAIA
jgi:hypothetical protein